MYGNTLDKLESSGVNGSAMWIKVKTVVCVDDILQRKYSLQEKYAEHADLKSYINFNL